jgi:hypothetical protein
MITATTKRCSQNGDNFVPVGHSCISHNPIGNDGQVQVYKPNWAPEQACLTNGSCNPQVGKGQSGGYVVTREQVMARCPDGPFPGSSDNR